MIRCRLTACGLFFNRAPSQKKGAACLRFQIRSVLSTIGTFMSAPLASPRRGQSLSRMDTIR
ncbi:hypothetical protein OYT88_12645 [Sporolactobacillus sp. CQH2019]|uniref:hypothetical protein n=1 Tax=Sporolactobacillus sp. CQH2019 TaxID=3023512 RepID=UPI0023689A71|nr:hypothetical protein [Sporolactobacillus sp. CQH2019]MDD9149391.1 hypothetical protein [Sporolactobacillus sp. CQH2019]